MLSFYADKGVILLTDLNSFNSSEFLRSNYDQNVPIEPQKRAAIRFSILLIAGIIELVLPAHLFFDGRWFCIYFIVRFHEL
ncbi:MAG: hypothetical protein WBG46_00255 [Nonlabens sp.]